MNPNASAEILNHDLNKIGCMGIQMENPDPSNQAQEVCVVFVMKLRRQIMQINGNMVQNTPNQKHLGLILDEKLTF